MFFVLIFFSWNVLAMFSYYPQSLFRILCFIFRHRVWNPPWEIQPEHAFKGWKSLVIEFARTSVILRALERELPGGLSSFLQCLKPGRICQSILFSPLLSETGSPAGLPGGDAIKGNIAQEWVFHGCPCQLELVWCRPSLSFYIRNRLFPASKAVESSKQTVCLFLLTGECCVSIIIKRETVGKNH